LNIFPVIFRRIFDLRQTVHFLFLLLIVLPVISFSEAMADDPAAYTKPISSIVIIGNESTDDNVILRELVVKKGSVPTQELMDESRKRLQNLYLFNRVELYLVPQDEKSDILIIELTEQWYFYPVPILTMRERDWKKWSYGLGVVHTNFRGQNEKIWGGIWFGYRPGFGLSYNDQWAGDSLHLTTGFALNKTTYNHRTLGFEERHHSGNISVGKWWNLYLNSDLIFLFDNVNVDSPDVVYMQSGQTTENLFGIAGAIRIDTRDLYSYPGHGVYLRLYAMDNGIFQKYNRYQEVDLDLRTYQPVYSATLAMRVFQSYLIGAVPVYRLNYLGYNERIRGRFYESWEGRNINLASIELRIPVIPIRYFSMDLPVIPPAYTRNLKVGLNAGIFADAGIIWSEPSEYAMANVISGFGFGLHFRLPYIEVFRIDYAFDPDWRGQIIVEVGVAF
jgi:outer membrane protein assembly factor BamA